MQNSLFYYFFAKKFAHIKKKQYLCTVIQKAIFDKCEFNILTIRFFSQMKTRCKITKNN